jgi:hypothetical protein
VGVEIALYTFRVNGRQTGLVRRTERTHTLNYERWERGAWVSDPNLARHFYCEGYDLEAVNELEAAHLAAQHPA